MINLIKIESQFDSSSQTFVESSSDNQLLLIEEDSSNESNESSSQSSYDCVENYLCNIKQVSVITSEQNFLMELIDKIPNPNLQKEYFKKYLKIQKQNNEKQLENTNQYNLKTILDQFFKPKPIGIQDLQNEISQIKLQINTMLIQNQEIETRIQTLENKKIQTIEDNDDSKQLEEGESSQLFVKTITKMITQKWYVKVKLLIKLDFSKEFLALVDFGVDVNCV